MKQRVGHVLVTCTLVTFDEDCMTISQIFNTFSQYSSYV